MTKRERERKIKMFGMIGMSVLVISSLATATYAWFTKINVTASTGIMTVSTIEQTTWQFYAYNGNLDEDYVQEGTFADDFTEITDSNKSTLATTDGLFAGDAVIFCIKVTELGSPTYNIKLNLTGLVSNTVAQQKGNSYSRKARKNSVVREVNVGWAMDIYTMGGSSADTYTSGVWSSDKFDYNFEDGSSITVDSGANKIELYNGAAVTPVSSTYYIFYQVYFSDDVTTHFTEKTNNTYDADADYPRTDSTARFFDYDEVGGNSNCFAALTFQLTNLELDVTPVAS